MSKEIKNLDTVEDAVNNYFNPFFFSPFQDKKLISKDSFQKASHLLIQNLDAFSSLLTASSFTQHGDDTASDDHLFALKNHCALYALAFKSQYPVIRSLKPLPFTYGKTIINSLAHQLEEAQYNPPRYIKTLAKAIGSVNYPRSAYCVNEDYTKVRKASTKDVKVAIKKAKELIKNHR